jgi:hypothetical protein
MYLKNDSENKKRNLNRCGCNEESDYDRRGRNNNSCYDEEEFENTINVTNTINITQTANANGGDGGDAEGGDATGGDAIGGSAAAASGVIATATATNVIDPEIDIPGIDDIDEELSTLQVDGGTAATGGNAVAGNTESGNTQAGTGGNGGTASNSVELTINNIIIISSEGSNPPTAFKVNNNGRNLDIVVDELGNTFVNGEKMDEKELKDGTKVLIFSSSQSQKAE